MSRTTQTTATKDEAKPALVPKLRFPEFRGGPPWDSDSLGNLAEMRSGGTPPSSVTHYYDGDIPWVSIADMTKAGKYITSTDRNLSRSGLENCSAQIFPVGTVIFAMYASIGECAITRVPLCSSQAILGIRPSSVLGNEFLYCYLTLLKPRLKSLGQHGTQANLNKNIVQNLKFPLPTPAEQQKIAECLSSVDELMAAQARKLDALKTHKKGLMQQLFPREGETQPRLRFPEFQNAGDWVEKRLKQLATYTKGFAFKSQDYKGEGVRIIRVSDLGPDFIKSDNDMIYLDADSASDHARYKLSQGDIIITTVGSKPELVDSAVGRGILVSKPNVGLLNQNLLKLEMLPGTDSRFLFCNINTALYQKFIVSISRGNANQANIAVKELMDFELKVPSPAEQQRIATCLSSLDDLITAETQKIDALKTHKKGLMQQLFPSPEEVAG